MLTYLKLNKILTDYDTAKAAKPKSRFRSSHPDQPVIKRIQAFFARLSLANDQTDRELSVDEMVELFTIIAASKQNHGISEVALQAIIRASFDRKCKEITLQWWRLLHRANLFTSENMEVICLLVQAYDQEHHRFKMMKRIHQLGLLNQDRFDKIVAHTNTREAAEAIKNYKKARKGKYSPDDPFRTNKRDMFAGGFLVLGVLAACLSPVLYVVLGLTILGSGFALAGIILAATIIVAFAIKNIATYIHNQLNYPLVESVDNLLSKERPKQYLDILCSWPLNTAANRELLNLSEHPEAIISFINLLHVSGLLESNRENLKAQIKNREINFQMLADFLYRCFGTAYGRKITQREFDALLNYSDILTNDRFRLSFLAIPQHLIGDTLFNQIIGRCAVRNRSLEDRLVSLERYINILRGRNQNNFLNNAQSTHTASVHDSVSESASKLMRRYGEEIQNLDVVLKEILVWAQTLDVENPIQRAAKSALTRVLNPKYFYLDSVSNVSLQQLLALNWKAIHDKKHRTASRKDALESFIKGLYESQRGDNLDGMAIDNQSANDKSICSPGTFNQIMAHIHHCDVEIIFMNRETAILKLWRVVVAEARKYLEEQFIKLDAKKFDKLLTLFEDDGIPKVVWEKIHPAVEKLMRDEFAALYKNKENEFVALVKQGIASELAPADIKRFRDKLIANRQHKPTGTSSNTGLFAARPLDIKPMKRPVRSLRLHASL